MEALPRLACDGHGEDGAVGRVWLVVVWGGGFEEAGLEVWCEGVGVWCGEGGWWCEGEVGGPGGAVRRVLCAAAVGGRAAVRAVRQHVPAHAGLLLLRGWWE